MSGSSNRPTNPARNAERATYGVLWALFKIAVLILFIAVAVIVGVNVLAK